MKAGKQNGYLCVHLSSNIVTRTWKNKRKLKNKTGFVFYY